MSIHDGTNASLASLPSAMKDSLTEEVSEILSSIGEVGLDAIMSESIIRDIPFISTVISVYKIGYSIKELHYIKNLATFINEMNSGVIDEEKRDRFRRRITDDRRKREKELEFVLILIDRYIDYSKPPLLAKLYAAYLDERITWNTFTKYAEVIDRFLPSDCETLVSATTFVSAKDSCSDSIQRLIALGLVIEGIHEMAFIDKRNDGHIEVVQPKQRKYARTEFGSTLVKILSESI